MTINEVKTQDQTTIQLDGRLDTLSAPELETVVNNSEETKLLVLDFEKTEYVSSAGLRILLAAKKKMDKVGGELKVINVCESIQEVFEMTGFVDILTIE